MIYELTPDSIELGLDAALPRVFELRGSIGEFGRGERSAAALPVPRIIVPDSIVLALKKAG